MKIDDFFAWNFDIDFAKESKNIKEKFEKLTLGIKKSSRSREKKLSEVCNLLDDMKKFKNQNKEIFKQIRALKYHQFEVDFEENLFLQAIKLKDQ